MLLLVLLTDTSETAGDTWAEDDLLGREVEMRALLLGALGLRLALRGVEVGLGDVSEMG